MARPALVDQAKTRFRTASTAETPNRNEMLLDKQFRNLEQWPDDVKAQRTVPGRERPMLTIDQISEPIRQVCNRQKEAKPSIQINPVSDGANADGAEVRQGLIRRIEVDGHAGYCRSAAFEDAVTCGLGYRRLLTAYEHNDLAIQDARLGDQKITFEYLENPLAVYCDPAAKAPDRRDARYYLIVQDVPKDEYTRQHPKSQLASLEDFKSLSEDYDPDWFPEGKIRLAEYYYRDVTMVNVCILPDGTVYSGKEAGTLTKEQKIGAIERTVEQATVKWALINAAEVLEERDIPGPWIPIIPTFGERLNINGKRVVRGLVRAARDSQRMYNYHNSALVEDLALAPKSKVIMAEGQEEGHEDQWDEANVRNLSYLLYKPTALGDKMVPGPTVAQFTDPAKIQSLVVAINQAKADLRSTTGWYDATDPGRKNADQSGRAILARKESQAQGAVNYLEELYWSLIFEAELLLAWLPLVYDRAGRVVEVLTGETQERSQVVLNQAFRKAEQPGESPTPLPDATPEQLLQGVATLYDLTRGQYGVTVSIGASYTTRRQEAVDWQLRLIESNPQFFGPMMADIAVRNMDGPGHQEIADRLERAVPPQVKGEDQKGRPEQQVQQLSQQMQQAQQLIDALTQQLNAANEKIELDTTREQAETMRQAAKIQAEEERQMRDLEAKERMAERENRTKILLAELERDTKLQIEAIKAETTRDNALLSAETARHASREPLTPSA